MKAEKAPCPFCGVTVPYRKDGSPYFHRTISNPTGCPGGPSKPGAKS